MEALIRFARDPDTAAKGQSLLCYRRMLGSRLRLHVWARCAVVIAIALGAVFAKYAMSIDNLDLSQFAILSTLLALYNFNVYLAVHRYSDEKSGVSYRILAGILHTTIFVDYIFLTVLLWLVGGARSPFQAFYLLHVIVGGVLLSPRAAWGHAIVGLLMFTALVMAEFLGIIPSHQPLGFVAGQAEIDGRFVVTVLAVQGVLVVLAAFFLTGLMHLLRDGESRLVEANAELEELNRMQKDFLKIALHNLKSPVAAVSHLLSAMESGYGGPVTEQQTDWIHRCRGRLGQINTFLKDLQLLSATESAALDENATVIDLRQLVKTLVDENQDLAKIHDHRMTAELPDSPVLTSGIPALLREAVVNFITNAIKYTPDGGGISVAVRNLDDEEVCIEVRDSGIGILPEDQSKLFRDFVRLKPPDGRPGNIEGSGLGLSIARRIAEIHGGRVGLSSEPHKGSTFYVVLPRVEVSAEDTVESDESHLQSLQTVT